MAICPSCEYPIPDDRERVGARCPSCRDPLYEPPGRFGRPVREGEGACGQHPECESVGPCGRCGNFMCETCRTKWRDQVLCAACVNRAMESKEAAPEQTMTHLRQAVTALGMAIGAWVLSLAGLLLAGLGVAVSGGQIAAAAIWLLLALATLLLAAGVALFGVGQAAAVLRARAGHMILATIGLIIGGLYVGFFMGLFAVSIYLGGT